MGIVIKRRCFIVSVTNTLKISTSERFHIADSSNLMQDEIESTPDQIEVTLKNSDIREILT